VYSDYELLLTEDEMFEVSSAICLGVPRDLALTAAGIEKERMRQIESLAQGLVEPYKSWIVSLKQGEARAKVAHLKKLAESPDWRARDKVLSLIEPSLANGAQAEYVKTYDWMLRVIYEETDNPTFERILARFAVEEPGTQVEGSQARGKEGQLQ
jgi:hypothetical protein